MEEQEAFDRHVAELVRARDRVSLAAPRDKREALDGLHAAVRAAQGVVPLLMLAGFLNTSMIQPD